MTLTVPLTTVQDQAGRAGEISGIGPVDPALARDLAAAAARNPRSTWCVTVTDQDGHAIGHGCARPEPKNHRKRAGPGPPGGTGTGNRDGPGFTFTATSQEGPPGGYGTWRLRIPGDGPDLIVTLDPITTRTAITGSRPRATIPGSSCGTWPRSATRPAPARSAGGPPASATSNIISPTRRAAGRACAMAARNAATTTGSSSTPAGTSTSFPTAPSCGPSHPGASTPPNPPGTPFDERIGQPFTPPTRDWLGWPRAR